MAVKSTPTVEAAFPATIEPKKYKSFTLSNLRQIPQISELPEEQIRAVEVVGSVLPFKTNNYVTDQLIDWNNVPNDPMFVLNFPQRDMLSAEHFDMMEKALDSGDKATIDATAHEIRLQLNPHPAGQLEHNVPMMNEEKLEGMQHKYRQTVLFFPSQGQTCHAYCSFCFRWPQFVGMDDHKFAMMESEKLIAYVREHPEVTDVLFTGGDPMVMNARLLANYIKPLVDADLPNLKTIRIGSKSLSYWPYKYINEPDTKAVLDILKYATDGGKHVALMAHFNHPVELSTPAVKQAIANIRAQGVQIRTQSPILTNINDSADAWAEMWQRQVDLGLIPYYMFLVRDTGAQGYFGVPLVKAWHIFREAYQRVSGVGRTVRGPSMSCDPGKVEVQGAIEIEGRKYLALRMIQGRNPDWVLRPFLAQYDEDAIWLNDLKPAFGEKFFFEDELAAMYREDEAETKAAASIRIASN